MNDMGFRLALLDLWTPRYVIRRELDRVSEFTTAALALLVEDNAPGYLERTAQAESPPRGSIEERRAAMARKHASLVAALEDAVGRDKAVALGRTALFEVGRRLGADARGRLGIGDGPEDLIQAARILYRVLGIEFKIEWQGPGNAKMIVERCALSKEYSELSCMVLSAADEGVVRGLNPSASMQFSERMTGACAVCKADIRFQTNGGRS